MNRKIKIAVFASGSGSNFAAIEEACRNGELNAEIVLMVTNKPEAFVVERAEKVSIPVAAFVQKISKRKMHMKKQFFMHFEKSGAEWLVLAGYMRLVGPVLIDGLSFSYR